MSSSFIAAPSRKERSTMLVAGTGKMGNPLNFYGYGKIVNTGYMQISKEKRPNPFQAQRSHFGNY